MGQYEEIQMYVEIYAFGEKHVFGICETDEGTFYGELFPRDSEDLLFYVSSPSFDAVKEEGLNFYRKHFEKTH